MHIEVYKNARGETVMSYRFFSALNTENITRHIMRKPYPLKTTVSRKHNRRATNSK